MASNDESPAEVILLDQTLQSTLNKSMFDKEIQQNELYWSREALEEQEDDHNFWKEKEVADELDSNFATSDVNIPMESINNDQINLFLNAIHKLSHLHLMKEGIQLPTIVVVGDQSSGKSSVLESLSGIRLPTGQGICTRVPLVMKLQHELEPEISLEFNGKTVFIDEAHVVDAITLATDEIAGDGKGISNTPLTLLVKKSGVPDLTMVDLPGINKDIYEQVSRIIMEYIKPEGSIILNVVSAAVELKTCESIRMSQQVDEHGERTLVVVTKGDESPDGLLEKVFGNGIKIGLGYVCVRNRIDDESYEEAREEEARIFANHPLLSKIDKNIVGIPVLAQKLVQIQTTIFFRCLPGIIKKTNDKLSACISTLDMPNERIDAFMRIVWLAMASMRKVLLERWYDNFLYDKNMHFSARLVEMVNQYQEDLWNSPESDNLKDFLKEEIYQLQQAILPETTFLNILQKKVNGVSDIPVSFLEKVWNYIESVVVCVLMHHSQNYCELQLCCSRAGHMAVAKMKERSYDWVTEYIEMEKLMDYTCSPAYMDHLNELMAQKNSFVNEVFYLRPSPPTIKISGFGCVPNSDYLKDCEEDLLSQAYDLRMRMTAYWKIIMWRFVDAMVIHIQLGIHKLVKEIESAISDEFISTHERMMMEESASIAAEREKLNARIELLMKSKEVLDNLAIN